MTAKDTASLGGLPFASTCLPDRQPTDVTRWFGRTESVAHDYTGHPASRAILNWTSQNGLCTNRVKSLLSMRLPLLGDSFKPSFDRTPMPYWFSHCRLDFDLRLVKNVMYALAKPVWPEWLAQKLGLRRLKTFTRFLQSISCSPSGETICMQGVLSYDLICCSELTRSICELTHLAGQLWQMASTLRLNNGRLWMQVGFMHTDERLPICSFESVQVISAKTENTMNLRYGYHRMENTGSRLFTEVKPCWTGMISGWVTI